jgi:Fusaric acid resistance protein-like
VHVVRLLLPPDPGALRLLAALRATLAGVVTFFLVVLLGSVAALPVTDRILGFGIALFIAANVRDGTPRGRLVTIAMAPLFAFAATALAALLFDQPLAAAVMLPLIMFAVAYGAPRGPRWASLGIVTLIAYFIGLVTHAPPATLPMRLVVLLLAGGVAALIRCVLLPERPRAELDRLHRAIHAGIVRVLDRIAAAVAAGTWTDPARQQLHEDVYRLDEVVMLAQARVAALAAELPGQGNSWIHLLAIELGIERVARVALLDLGTPADRGPLLAALAELRRGAEPPPPQSTSMLAATLAPLGHVMHEPRGTGPTPVAAPPPASAPQGLRSAVQTAAATALAIAAGDLVSPNRWYWAAFAAFVMFQGTRSQGESIVKGAQFIIGTVAGVLFGILVGTSLSGHEILNMAAIVAAVFLAFQANVAAYGTMVFWITVILGLMFGMLGFFAPELLLLRLEETAVGAACGGAVASLVLLRQKRVPVEDAVRAFLQALGHSVDDAAHALLDGTPPPDLANRIVMAEQRFRDLSAIAQAERLGLATRNEALRRRVLVLEGCELWARELGQIGLQSVNPLDPGLATLVRKTVARIDAAVIEANDSATNRSATDDQPAGALVPAPGDDLPRAVRLLLRIEAALVHFASR